jgi:hypothetical protein
MTDIQAKMVPDCPMMGYTRLNVRTTLVEQKQVSMENICFIPAKSSTKRYFGQQ